jgi:hypothetical protein
VTAEVVTVMTVTVMTVAPILFLLLKTTVAAQVNTLTMVREDEGVHAV